MSSLASKGDQVVRHIGRRGELNAQPAAHLDLDVADHRLQDTEYVGALTLRELRTLLLEDVGDRIRELRTTPFRPLTCQPVQVPLIDL